MARLTTAYYPGGYDPASPSGNRYQEWDHDQQVYTEWDTAGAVVEHRPFLPDEVSDDPGQESSLVAVQVDPDALSAIIASGQKATTVAALRSAFVALGQQLQS